jgi:hypothetical protein
MQMRDFTLGDYAAATALWERCGLHPSASDTPARLAGVARHNPGLFVLAFEGDALVEERLRERCCDKVNLLIEPDNAAVADFYAAAGYTRDPLIFMEKWL